MNDDLISRKWLMECVDEGWIKFDTEKDKNRYIHLVRDIAPSAQPERKKGKWIFPYETTTMVSICSECGTHGRGNFCPNCGAYMIGGEDK